MSGLLEIERHNLGAFFGDFLLVTLSLYNPDGRCDQHRTANHQRTAGDEFACSFPRSVFELH